MMAGCLVFIAAFAGFGLLSLAMQRHAPALSGIAPQWNGQRGKVVLRTLGTAALAVSVFLALHENSQLGAIFWSGYAMAAVLLVVSLHAWAARWAASIILLGATAFVGLALGGL